ncbi:N-acetylglucosamine kinase [Olivibacter sp. CPCC 100613]|uniref:N-acetylglucosamine kinase n=1 Tax=Olivibacter sp. CPCC 100613 TaxID=3079931 RepID=UPI002FF61714
MILVVDSGSYKSDWMLALPDSEPLTFRTRGLNPFFTTEKEIVKIVQNITDIAPYADLITEVYFFGSGCTNPDRRELVSNALSQIFKKAFISVETDLIGSAYATCGNDSGYTAVLGTGSNVTFFDGEQVQPTKQGLGFILGDEGSGAWFGKKLITAFLYGALPEELSKKFESTYRINKEIVIKNVYQRNSPNTYLASFAPFMESNQTHPYIMGMLHRGFEEFVKTNILLFPDYQSHLFHFVGSIAYYFSEQLRVVCEQYAVQIGKIIKQPIEELFNFVIERETV